MRFFYLCFTVGALLAHALYLAPMLQTQASIAAMVASLIAWFICVLGVLDAAIRMQTASRPPDEYPVEAAEPNNPIEAMFKDAMENGTGTGAGKLYFDADKGPVFLAIPFLDMIRNIERQQDAASAVPEPAIDPALVAARAAVAVVSTKPPQRGKGGSSQRAKRKRSFARSVA